MKKVKIEISPAFAAGLGILIALDPASLWCPFLLAALFHELGHGFCLRLLKIPVLSIRVGMSGTVIETALLSGWREALCAAAGPFVNLVVGISFARAFPAFSFLNLLLMGFNLLPVFPLDGGRIVRAFFPEAAHVVSSAGIVILTLIGGVMTSILHEGLWPVILVSILLAKIAVQRGQEQKLFANRPSSVYNIQR